MPREISKKGPEKSKKEVFAKASETALRAAAQHVDVSKKKKNEKSTVNLGDVYSRIRELKDGVISREDVPKLAELQKGSLFKDDNHLASVVWNGRHAKKPNREGGEELFSVWVYDGGGKPEVIIDGKVQKLTSRGKNYYFAPSGDAAGQIEITFTDGTAFKAEDRGLELPQSK